MISRKSSSALRASNYEEVGPRRVMSSLSKSAFHQLINVATLASSSSLRVSLKIIANPGTECRNRVQGSDAVTEMQEPQTTENDECL